MKNSTPEKLADKWIRQMQKANFTPDQMLECLKLAREKYEAMVYSKNRYQELHKIATSNHFADSFTYSNIEEHRKRFEILERSKRINDNIKKVCDNLIEINRTVEKERLNKIMEKTIPFPSGGIITGNGFIDWLKKNQ